MDPTAHGWANELREAVLAAAQADPASAARTLFEHALGPDFWTLLPADAQDIFAAGSAAMLAEVRGQGLDLSADPFAPTAEELAAVDQPVLLLSAEDSYAAGRAVDDRLTAALPKVRHEIVTGDHLIHPAHPAVLEFVADVLRGG
jgi:pimeloyl-ACP methyl ester carboxylesterase